MADDLECDEDLDIDFRRLKNVHLKAGYREGLDSGEESTIQQGFNEGFSDSVCVGRAASKLLGSISAVLCFINSKKTQVYNELRKDLAKIKEDVEILEQNALQEYEALVIMPDGFVESMMENASKPSSEAKCCGGNTNEQSFECCSEKKDFAKQQQPYSHRTNCCSQETQPACETETSCCGKCSPEDSARSCSDGNISKQQRDVLCTSNYCSQNEESSDMMKPPSRTLLDKFYRDIESLEKQFSVLIEKEILSG